MSDPPCYANSCLFSFVINVKPATTIFLVLLVFSLGLGSTNIYISISRYRYIDTYVCASGYGRIENKAQICRKVGFPVICVLFSPAVPKTQPVVAAFTVGLIRQFFFTPEDFIFQVLAKATSNLCVEASACPPFTVRTIYSQVQQTLLPEQ